MHQTQTQTQTQHPATAISCTQTRSGRLLDQFALEVVDEVGEEVGEDVRMSVSKDRYLIKLTSVVQRKVDAGEIDLFEVIGEAIAMGPAAELVRVLSSE
jgi:hypothetical protein